MEFGILNDYKITKGFDKLLSLKERDGYLQVIEKLTKTHHKKWLKGLLGKKYIIEGGSRKSSTKKYKNNGHKKTRRA